jgi:hypothetical protein
VVLKAFKAGADPRSGAGTEVRRWHTRAEPLLFRVHLGDEDCAPGLGGLDPGARPRGAD